MKTLLKAVPFAALTLTANTPAEGAGWPRCNAGRDDDCPPVYLNVVTRQGDARVSVERSCRADWRHDWGRNDARRTIRQWLAEDAPRGAGALCVQLGRQVDEIRIVSTGGHCGETATSPETASANKPGPDIILRRGYGSGSVATLPGCHATIGTGEAEIAYGGIALDFADGYGFGDSYARGHFYGVYDGFGQGKVRPFRADLRAISEFNTFHYRVEVLANGRAILRGPSHEENDR